MRGLMVVLSLGFLKGIWMRYFLSKPERRNQVSAEAASKVRLGPDGAAQDFQYPWPNSKQRGAPAPDNTEE